MAVAEKKKFTEADYQLLEESAPYQLIDGDLIMSPAPTSYHQLLSIRLSSMIQVYLEKVGSKGVCLYAPIDVKFDNENIFQPDLIYISAERKDELFHDQIFGAPDLIVEILSPSTASYDLKEKKSLYERYGVKEYLIIDPKRFYIEVYVLTKNKFELQQKEKQNGTINLNTLPGLQIDLQKLFA